MSLFSFTKILPAKALALDYLRSEAARDAALLAYISATSDKVPEEVTNRLMQSQTRLTGLREKGIKMIDGL